MRPWIPVLSSYGHAEAAAQDAIDAIAKAVVDASDSPGAQGWAKRRGEDEALLYAYLAAARRDDAWADRAVQSLNAIVENPREKRLWFALYGGLSGLGWALEHVSHLLDDAAPAPGGPTTEPENGAEDEDPSEEIDTALVAKLRQPGPLGGDYDLISGLVGNGVYFLERWPKASAADGLALVVQHLETLSRQMNPGIAWYTEPDLLSNWQREVCAEGYYNLGVAHGIPGIIRFLSDVTATGVETDRAQRLLEGAVEWLIAQRRPSDSRSWFSSWLAPGQPGDDSRLSWCYGDLGVLAILLPVAKRAGREDWARFAHDLLDHCLARPFGKTGIADAALCHGAAGNAQIFSRLYQHEGDTRCRDAARMWFDHALAMRQPGMGVGGFLALTRPEPAGPMIWEASPAFLDGAIGVALALLSAVAPIEPNWDRLLLLSGRPSSA